MADAASTPQDDAMRADIAARLAGGLKTEAMERPAESDAFNAIVARLQRDGATLEQKLVIGGFTDHPIEVEGIEQACETCMYYLVHRRFCDLPELLTPVEPHWSCRLWRI